MKQFLLSEPICLIIVLVTLIVCSAWLFILANHKSKIEQFLEQIFVRFFLLAGIEYINFLGLASLGISVFIINSGFFMISSWSIMLLILSKRVIGFCRMKLIPLLLISIQGNPFIWMVILLSLMSSLWSGTPVITLKAAIVLALINIFSLYLVHQYGDKSFNLWRATMTLMGFLSVFIRHTTHGDGGGLAGVLGSKNGLGSMMAINTAWWCWQVVHDSKLSERLISMGIATTSFCLIIAADSAGGKFTFIVLLFFLLLMPILRKIKFKIAVVVVILFIFISSVISFYIIDNLANIFSYAGKDMTLTGRTDLWAVVWNSVQQRLWLGYGLYGFWQNWRLPNSPSAQIINMLGWEPPNAHQGFLDIAVDLGLIGLLLMIFSLSLSIIQATLYMIKKKETNSIVPLLLLMYVIMANISESRFLRSGSAWFIYILATIKLSLIFGNRSSNSTSSNI